MTFHRSLLQPLRTRRLARPTPFPTPGLQAFPFTPSTRQTLAAVGSSWVSFAASSSSVPPAPVHPDLGFRCLFAETGGR